MENKGRRPDQQKTNETLAFISMLGLVIIVIILLIISSL